MGALPFLSASFRRRFDPAPDGGLQPGDGWPAQSPLMRILTPALMHKVNNLSPVGKLDRNGRAVVRWNYGMTPMVVTAMLLRTVYMNGTYPSQDEKPFALKAIGPVNAERIRRGGKGLVSDKFAIVP